MRASTIGRMTEIYLLKRFSRKLYQRNKINHREKGMYVRGAVGNLCDLEQRVYLLELGHWCYLTQGGWNLGRL